MITVDEGAMGNNSTQPLSQIDKLTLRDLRMLRAVAEGDTNAEIANQFGITETHVKSLIRGACLKLGARNRAHACILAYKKGLI